MTDFKEQLIKKLDEAYARNALPNKCMCYWKGETMEKVVPVYCPVHGFNRMSSGERPPSEGVGSTDGHTSKETKT